MEFKLLETRLQRVWQFIQDDDKSFVMLSPYQLTNSAEENGAAMVSLVKYLSGKRYGYIFLKGGYKYKDEISGAETDVLEQSLMIPGLPKEEVMNIGKEFNQESIIYKDANEFSLISTLPTSYGEEELSFKQGEWKDNMEFSKDVLQSYFSELSKGSHAGKRFTFKMKEREDMSWMKAMKLNGDTSKLKWSVYESRLEEE